MSTRFSLSHMLRRHLGLIDFTLAASRRRLSRNLILLGVYTLLVFLLASVMFFALMRSGARLR